MREGKWDGDARVDGRVTPALVVKATLGVKILEEGGVRLAAPEVHVSDLEVAPD